MHHWNTAVLVELVIGMAIFAGSISWFLGIKLRPLSRLVVALTSFAVVAFLATGVLKYVQEGDTDAFLKMLFWTTMSGGLGALFAHLLQFPASKPRP